MGKIASYTGMFVVSILGIIFSGYVISELWLWFAVPLGIVAISVAEAIGLQLLVSSLTMKPMMAINPDMKGWTLAICTPLAMAFIWGTGAIVHLFV